METDTHPGVSPGIRVSEVVSHTVDCENPQKFPNLSLKTAKTLCSNLFEGIRTREIRTVLLRLKSEDAVSALSSIDKWSGFPGNTVTVLQLDKVSLDKGSINDTQMVKFSNAVAGKKRAVSGVKSGIKYHD